MVLGGSCLVRRTFRRLLALLLAIVCWYVSRIEGAWVIISSTRNDTRHFNSWPFRKRFSNFPGLAPDRGLPAWW